MSERKVLNKYYPPDFDPSKIPRMKCSKNRQFTVRLMAPFNMRCATCGEYIYKGKKFNAKKEDVEGEDYLGIRIFRFYIKCTRCLQEISFKTDPRNTDYEIEAGATRNFMALKLAEEQAEREEEERREEEASNPMKLLENRTKQSKHELDILESLEELKDLNKRQQSVDYDVLLSQFSSKEAQERIKKLQEEEDERFVKSVFGGKRVISEEIVPDVDTTKKKRKGNSKNSVEPETDAPSSSNLSTLNDSSTSLMSTLPSKLVTKPVDRQSQKSIGVFKRPLSNLVKLKSAEKVAVSNDEHNKHSNPSTETNSTSITTCSQESAYDKPKPSALSLLGSYSGSDSDSN